MRVDPARQQIAELSIPRDLRAEIPGHGADKINAAYASAGRRSRSGPCENLTGHAKVNHVVLVNFAGFGKLIDALGGVTIDNPTKIISNSSTAIPGASARGSCISTAATRWRTRASARTR